MTQYTSSTEQCLRSVKNQEVGGWRAQHAARAAAHNVYQHTVSVMLFIQTLQKI